MGRPHHHACLFCSHYESHPIRRELTSWRSQETVESEILGDLGYLESSLVYRSQQYGY